MFEIGPSLREARNRRGLSPADVHKAIRIRERYLGALEQERWELLPGDAYTKGFLRTYAEFLGLDGELYVDEYNARIGQREEAPFLPESNFVGGRRRSVLFRTGGLAALVAVLVVGFAAWRHVGARARPTLEPAAAAAAPKPTFAVVRAVRERAWLSIRIGGREGREIYRGTLESGHALRLGLRHGLWIRMRRPRALEIRVGARHVGLPTGPATITLRR